MSERNPWMPDGARLLQILELMAKPAQDCGQECLAQFFVMTPVSIEGGGEAPACGQLRYTPERVLRDFRELPEGINATVCCVVRHEDPNTPEGAAWIAFHEKARELERESLEGAR